MANATQHLTSRSGASAAQHTVLYGASSLHWDEPPGNWNSWDDVVKGKSRIFLPIFDPSSDINILPLSNSFVLLAELADSLAPASWSTACDRQVRKHSVPSANSASSCSASPERKCTRISGQTTNHRNRLADCRACRGRTCGDYWEWCNKEYCPQP